jgi:aminoglycoside phosphotransferase (APT) family kinase protein
VTNTQPENTTPWRRDIGELGSALATWARSERGDGVQVSDVRAPASGMANETVLFRLDGEPLVARLAPLPSSPYPTFPAFDLAFQEWVMRLVRERTSVCVPEVVYLERSEEWLGAPFLLLRAIDGVVPSDSPPYLLAGWMLEGSDDDRARLEQASIEVLVALHKVVDDGPATAFLRPDVPGDTALARQLAFQRRYYEWACEGTPVPALERAFKVLAATLPATRRSVLNWGDSRIGNILYRDFEPVAVLDWEMASVGPPEVDLGWMTFFHAFFQGMAEEHGFPGLPDLFDRARAVATYKRLSGDIVEDLAWYEAFAALRFGIISIRTSLRSVAYGLHDPPVHPDDVILFLPLLHKLLSEL